METGSVGEGAWVSSLSPDHGRRMGGDSAREAVSMTRGRLQIRLRWRCPIKLCAIWARRTLRRNEIMGGLRFRYTHTGCALPQGRDVWSL